MKLYDGLGPNPRPVRMFIAEKKLDVPGEIVDLMSGANQREPGTRRNPFGELPSLQLDPANRNLTEWFARPATRPSAAASTQPRS